MCIVDTGVGRGTRTTPGAVSELTAQAAHALRDLGRVTRPATGYAGLRGPLDVDDVVAGLTAVAGDLAEVTEQLAGYLETHEPVASRTAPPLLDANAPPAVVVGIHHLDTARAAAGALRRALGQAHASLAALVPRQ